MTEEQDADLTALYQRLDKATPSQLTDARIRHAARQQLQSQKRPLSWTRWASVAAVLVLSVGVVLRVINEQPIEQSIEKGWLDTGELSEPAKARDELPAAIPAEDAMVLEQAVQPAFSSREKKAQSELQPRPSPEPEATLQMVKPPVKAEAPASASFADEQPGKLSAPVEARRSKAVAPAPKAMPAMPTMPAMTPPADALTVESEEQQLPEVDAEVDADVGVGVGVSSSTSTPMAGQGICEQMLQSEADPQVWIERIRQLQAAGDTELARCLEQSFQQRFGRPVPNVGDGS